MMPVTGGASFIGSHLVDALLTAGQEQVVLDNFAGGDLKNLPNGVKLVKMDIADARVVEVIVELKPEVVIHAAAQVSVADSMQDPHLDLAVNVQGTANVLEGAKVAGARRVSSSSPRAAGSTASLMTLTKPPCRVRRATTAHTGTSGSATRS
jgi:UDP-glucose 4-epimerase